MDIFGYRDKALAKIAKKKQPPAPHTALGNSPTARGRGRHQPPDPGTGKAVIESFSFHNRIYELRRNSCGKANCTVCNGNQPTHGPYWYMCVSVSGRWRRIYLGKELDTTKFVDAEGNLQLPPPRGLPAHQRPAADAENDQPGQTVLFHADGRQRQTLLTCPQCHHEVLENSADHLMLTRSARCPACRVAIDVSLIRPCYPS